MARRRRRRKNTGDQIVVSLILVALVWAFAPGVGWDLLDLRSRLGWPPLRSGQALSSLPDSEAARQLRELTVRESVDDPAAPAYDREAFGQRWADTDHNGCDTRNDILARDLKTISDRRNTCVITAGQLADPYSGKWIDFRKKEASKVQIDHVVALENAWQSGAYNLTQEDREALANDPDNLLAVNGHDNMAKGSKSADQWMPPNTAYACTYASKQVQIKNRYALTVTTPEKQALADALATCPTN